GRRSTRNADHAATTPVADPRGRRCRRRRSGCEGLVCCEPSGLPFNYEAIPHDGSYYLNLIIPYVPGRPNSQRDILVRFRLTSLVPDANASNSIQRKFTLSH